MVNLPVFLTSLVATSARTSRILDVTDFFSSQPVANASAMPPLLMALTATFFFIGAMLLTNETSAREREDQT